jgi:hypothetical protein
VSPLARFSPFAVSFAITSTFFINFCAWIFQCGCRSLWAGADAACNIHAMHSRHCPWCSHGLLGQALVMILLCAPQLAIAAFTPWNWTVRTLAATAAFPVSGLGVALAFGKFDEYWIWIA